MKAQFPGYYRPSKPEFDQIWRKCIFAFDANILLNLYRYGPSTRDEFLDLMERFEERLWIPHHAAKEFFENRLGVIQSQTDAYDDICTILQDARGKIESELSKFKRHIIIDVPSTLEEINRVFRVCSEKISASKSQHPITVENDPLLDKITKIFGGRVGLPYSKDVIREKYKAASERIEGKIPPGYNDAHKDGNKKYGDVVLWMQILEFAKKNKKPIVLVTDDRKDDWWLRHEGKILSPRPELIEEMAGFANQKFYMYSSDSFLKFGSDFIQRSATEEAMDEIRMSRERQEARERQEKFHHYIDLTESLAKKLSSVEQDLSMIELDEVKLRDQLTELEMRKTSIEDVKIVDGPAQYIRQSMYIQEEIGDVEKRISLLSNRRFSLFELRKSIIRKERDLNILMGSGTEH